MKNIPATNETHIPLNFVHYQKLCKYSELEYILSVEFSCHVFILFKE